MQINLVYEQSTTLAPAGFYTAMQYAAQQLDALLTDNITVSIDIGWDASGQVLGEAGPENMLSYDYGTVVEALQAHARGSVAQTAAGDMPATDPTDGNGVYLSEAQAEALGVMSGTSLPDGTATFGTGGAVLNFSTSDLAVAGQIDFVGVAEHELTHALGRAGWGAGADPTSPYSGLYSLMDLFRFSAPGVLVNNANATANTSVPAYFSIDDGQTSLASYATSSDYYDWSSAEQDDSFDAVSEAGVANTISVPDQELMAALGFNVACFCPGTRIATPGGEVAVETLAIGDAVITKAGVRRIKWIGRSAYEGRFLGKDPLLLPVIFAPGALGEGIPASALTVSPGHAVWLADVLVPAWRLVNGVSVTQPAQAGEVRYIHIELEQHGLLLSDGAWSESYLNETPRSWFQNAAEYAALYPGEDVAGPPCLPRVEDGAALLALQQYVNGRAGMARAAETDGALLGEVDYVAHGVCAGWAQCGEAPVTLFLMRGGEILARMIANRYREDLHRVGHPGFCQGFAVNVPPGEGAIAIRRALDGAVLPMVAVRAAA